MLYTGYDTIGQNNLLQNWIIETNEIIEKKIKDGTLFNDLYERVKEVEGKSNRDEQYRFPILPGMPLCLNPEHPRYEDYKAYFGDEKLYMVSLNGVKEGEDWAKEEISNLETWNIRVESLSGKNTSMRYTSVFQVEAEPVTILRYALRDYGTQTRIKEALTQEDKDEMVICGVTSYKCYDSAWRAKVMQDITTYYEKHGKKL